MEVLTDSSVAGRSRARHEQRQTVQGHHPRAVPAWTEWSKRTYTPQITQPPAVVWASRCCEALTVRRSDRGPDAKLAVWAASPSYAVSNSTLLQCSQRYGSIHAMTVWAALRAASLAPALPGCHPSDVIPGTASPGAGPAPRLVAPPAPQRVTTPHRPFRLAVYSIRILF